MVSAGNLMEVDSFQCSLHALNNIVQKAAFTNIAVNESVKSLRSISELLHRSKKTRNILIDIQTELALSKKTIPIVNIFFNILINYILGRHH